LSRRSRRSIFTCEAARSRAASSSAQSSPRWKSASGRTSITAPAFGSCDDAVTPEAKALLSTTIRGTSAGSGGLRERLLRDLHEAVNGRYRFDTPIEKAGLDEAGRTRRLRFEAWLDERARTTKPKNKAQLEEAKARFRLVAEKEAAATLLTRLV